MNDATILFATHDHVFLGAGHEKNERKTWAVIVLCAVMMAVEIVGGSLFGSLALVADGLHMSTHASAMLIAALAYRYARRHATDRRFVFGTGKLGDLAGFTSAVILAMIALLIGYEAISRVLAPVPIRFMEAIPIACVGLAVNIASAWLLSGDDHHHHHGHGHGHGHGDGNARDDSARHAGEETKVITSAGTRYALSVFEDGVAPVFRVAALDAGTSLEASAVTVTTERADGSRQIFHFTDRGGYLESTTEIPEPHAFTLRVSLAGVDQRVEFEEHGHDHGAGVDARDHNIRAAYVHVLADAAVSVLAIIGLSLAKAFGWLWMDPLAGIVGALVIANWSYGLMRDTGGILLDISPSDTIEKKVRAAVEAAGDTLLDLHVWRLGPGHFAAVVSVLTQVAKRNPAFYHSILRGFNGLSHITVEVHERAAMA
jgi:cation diffusion facilitator family transporter